MKKHIQLRNFEGLEISQFDRDLALPVHVSNHNPLHTGAALP